MFVVISWKYFGFHMILMLAGLQGIPRELEEAAAIDGATRRQTFRRHAAAPRADDPGLGLPVDHRRAPAVRPRLGHDGRRPRRRLEHDGDVPGRLGLRAHPVGYGSAVAVILFRSRPRRRAGVPALRPAPRHRRRDDEDGGRMTARHAPAPPADCRRLRLARYAICSSSPRSSSRDLRRVRRASATPASCRRPGRAARPLGPAQLHRDPRRRTVLAAAPEQHR